MSRRDYDKGFDDGLKFVAELLRRSALIVEAPIRGDYERTNAPSISAIARLGNPKLASSYRAIADLLEDATKDNQNAAPTTASH